MPTRKVAAGSTGIQETGFAQDVTSSTGAGLSIAYNSSGIVAEYRGELDAAWVPITLVNKTLGTFTSGGLCADGSLTGAIAFDPPNGVFGTGRGKKSTVRIYGVANMLPIVWTYELDAINYQDGVHAGLTALPNTACTTNGSLLTSGSGTDQLSVSSGRVDLGRILGNNPTTTTNGILDVNVKNYNNHAAVTDANNYPSVNLVDIAGAAVNTSAAQLGVNVVNYKGLPTATDVNGYPSVNVVDIGGTFTAGQPGYIGIDWSAIHGIAAAVNLSGTTINALTNLPAIPANWISAAGIAAGALSGKGDWLLASNYTAPDNLDIQANAVILDKLNTMLATSGANWTLTQDALKNAPTGAGGNVTVGGYAAGMSPASQVLKNGNPIASDINGFVTVTNPVSGSVPSNQIVFDGESFTIGTRCAVSQNFSATGIDATGWTEMCFFIKNCASDSDAAAAIAIKLRNPTAGGDGLIYQNGAPVSGSVTASDGSLSNVTIVTGTSTSFTLNLTAAGAGIPAGNYVWEAAYWINAQRSQYLGTGTLIVQQSAIRSTMPL